MDNQASCGPCVTGPRYGARLRLVRLPQPNLVKVSLGLGLASLLLKPQLVKRPVRWRAL